MKVSIVTPGFETPNGRAFLFPILVHRPHLAAMGVHVTLFDKPCRRALDCDVIAFDSKYRRLDWHENGQAILDEIGGARESVGAAIFFDTLDSAGWVHARPLQVVDLYCKAQLLRDRSHYLRPLYQYRLFTDFTHRSLGIEDTPAALSEPVRDPALLRKLRVSWNSGLADYSWLGPTRMAAYRYLPTRALLSFPGPAGRPDGPRPRTVSCRFGVSYPEATVRHQRERVRALMASHLSTDKLGRRAYLRELAESRIIVSPFGYGEITLKDFEGFLSGGALLKPDMDHMETWPHLFRGGETIATHAWDLEDFEEVLGGLIGSPERCRALAEAGQRTYLRHTRGPDAAALFCEHFKGLLDEARGARAVRP